MAHTQALMSTAGVNAPTCGVCKLRHNRNKLCADVFHHIRMVRSTACDNCFKLKALYNFRHVGLADFDPDDYLSLTFTKPVELVGWTGPLSNVYYAGEQRLVDRSRFVYRTCFDLGASFDDKMEFTAGKLRTPFLGCPESRRVRRTSAETVL